MRRTALLFALVVVAVGTACPGTLTPGEPEPSAGWTSVAAPCGGSTTGALFFDDATTGYVGCGENAEGTGLFVTDDGGATFTPARDMEQVRVNDVLRGPDGVLYAAGIHTSLGGSAFSLAGDDLTPTALFEPGNNAFSAVRQAENVAVTAGGRVFVDSLTGTSAAYSEDGATFEETSTVDEALLDDPDAAGVSVRRVVAVDEAFFAVGSLINDPATVRLPSRRPEATFHLEGVPVQGDNEDGELMDLVVFADDDVLVAGYDQSAGRALMRVGEGDLYDPASWTAPDLSAVDDAGRVRALARVGDTVVAVGERVPTSAGGFLWHSDDGGRTFTDRTDELPDAPGPLSEVWLFEDGAALALGGGGEGWRFTP